MELEVYNNDDGATRTASGIPLKDPDSIKLFVGQVPRSMDEDDIKAIFAQYGELYELLVLRDKLSGTHKGCAFVTFCTLESAEKAQRALHGITVLPGMSRPIQVKPANSDDAAKLERKVFVGMISKQATEEDIRTMFSLHGEIDELSILKNPDGNSKGCAFVKYVSGKDCQKAIRSMHHSLTMQGCSSPIVVKWADTDKERVVRRAQKVTEGQPGFNAVQHAVQPRGNMSAYNIQPQYQPPPPPAPYNNSNNNTAALLSAITPLLQNLAGQSNPETNKALVNALIAALQALANCNNTTGNSRALTDIANLLNGTVSSASNHQQQQQQPQIHSQQQHDNISHQQFKVDAMSYNSMGHQTSIIYSNSTTNIPQNPNKQSEGPDGANLFIYHIPAELRDNDLTEMFSAFGTILSCKIFIDKATNQSKCFGFVSFENAHSAQVAINAMNGFKIGSKRLKVQLKKPRDAGKPF